MLAFRKVSEVTQGLGEPTDGPWGRVCCKFLSGLEGPHLWRASRGRTRLCPLPFPSVASIGASSLPAEEEGTMPGMEGREGHASLPLKAGQPGTAAIPSVKYVQQFYYRLALDT